MRVAEGRNLLAEVWTLKLESSCQGPNQ